MNTRSILFFPLIALSSLVAQILPSGTLVSWDPGVPGGIPDIQGPVVSVLDYGTVADGATNDLAAFQSALAALSGGGVLYVPAGDYFLDGSLQIGTDGIVLRGEGAQKSRLLFGSAVTASIDIVTYGRGNWQTLTSAPSRGDKVISVPDPSAFTIGEFLEIQKENDAALMYTNPQWNQSYAQNARGQIAEVTDIQGNNITLKHALYLSYPLADLPQVRSQRLVKYVGIEDIYLERIQNNDDVSTVQWKNAAYVWMRGVESKHTRRAHVATESVIGCQVENSYFHHSFDYGGGGHGYGISTGFHTTDCLIENNVFRHLRHSMIISKGASGNVFGYNYSTEVRQSDVGESNYNDGWIPPDISVHGHWSNNNLFESNTVQQVGIADYWGPTGPHVVYARNRVVNDNTALNGSTETRAIQLDDNSNYQYLLGNVVENGGIEDDGTPDMSTNLVHGHTEYGSTSWDPLVSDHTIPTSFYWSCKPNFLDAVAWPLTGPDVAQKIELPAESRFLISNFIAPSYTRTCSDSNTTPSLPRSIQDRPKNVMLRAFDLQGRALGQLPSANKVGNIAEFGRKQIVTAP